MLALDPHTPLRRRQDIIASDLSPTETVMMDLDVGTYFGMENISKIIWDKLATPCTLPELYQYLGDRFEVDQETLEKETIAFLNELESNKLINQIF